MDNKLTHIVTKLITVANNITWETMLIVYVYVTCQASVRSNLIHGLSGDLKPEYVRIKRCKV